MNCKAVTLHQPWATIIAAGLKEYETRSWPTNYRGPLAIHAGRKSSEPGLNLVMPKLPLPVRLHVEGMVFPLGAVVCLVDLVDCIQMTAETVEAQSPLERAVGDWSPGRYAWRLENVRQVKPPAAVIGAQGLWDCKVVL